MSKEAGWIATMLAVLLIVVALLSPRAAGRLPTLEEVERPPATICNVPLIGPLFGQVQRLVTRATWQLETVPIE